MCSGDFPRRSCRVPPCRPRSAKRIECLAEPMLHDGRFDRGENAVAMRSYNIRGRGRHCGCGIESPAKMLASVTQPDLDAVMGQHFVVERADQCELFAK